MTSQTTLEGESAKEEGKARVESHNQDFIESMRNLALYLAQTNGFVTTDQLHEWADSRGIAPRHPNAFGAIFRGPQWRSAGFVKSKRPSAHARMIREWVLA